MSEPVFVQFAKPPGGGKGGGGGGFGGGGGPGGGGADKIFVGDIPTHFDDNAVTSLFSQYGSVVDVKVLPPRTPGEKGAALVRFASPDQAKAVVDTCNGQIIP